MNSENKIPKSHKEIISKLNFNKFKREIIKEINRARSDPHFYQLKLEEILSSQDPKETKAIITINGIQIRLIEGKSALHSAIEFLKKQKCVKKIKILTSMDSAANELLQHLIEKEGLIDSEQILYKDIYDPETRLNKHGKCFGAVDEIIDCGCFDAEVLVISLILGDGDENRLERNTLFLEEFKFAGIATSILPKSQRICSVVNICEEYFSPGEYIPKTQRKVKFCCDDDDYKIFENASETVKNKLYLSKKFYEKTETITPKIENNSNKNKEKEENNKIEYCEETESTQNSYSKKDENVINNSYGFRSRNLDVNVIGGIGNRRKSSFLTYKGKKNSIDKFISFFNDQERYLDTIFEKMGKDFKDGIEYSSDENDQENDKDCYEYYDITEEITTKKITSRRNKTSVVSFNEIEELEKEKKDVNLPRGIHRITWNEKKFTDPLDKKAYFIVEKNTFKDDGEVIRVVYTKY